MDRKAKDVAEPADGESTQPEIMSVRIHAKSVRQIEKGVWVVDLPSRPMSEREHAMLKQFFPNLTERAYDLLNKEALLQATE